MGEALGICPMPAPGGTGALVGAGVGEAAGGVPPPANRSRAARMRASIAAAMLLPGPGAGSTGGAAGWVGIAGGVAGERCTLGAGAVEMGPDGTGPDEAEGATGALGGCGMPCASMRWRP